MENCLVTKLKATVSNNLPRLGTFRVDISNNLSSTSVMYIKYPLNIAKPSYSILNANGDIISTIPCTNDGSKWNTANIKPSDLPSGSHFLEFSSKYNIETILLGVPNLYYDLKSLSYSTLKSIILIDTNHQNSLVWEDISSLSNVLEIISFSFMRINVSLTMTELGTLQKLQYLTLNKTAVTGTLEDYCESLYTNSVNRSRSITGVFTEYIKFHNTTASGATWYITLADTIVKVGTTQGGSELGSYNGTTWTYNS